MAWSKEMCEEWTCIRGLCDKDPNFKCSKLGKQQLIISLEKEVYIKFISEKIEKYLIEQRIITKKNVAKQLTLGL